MPESGGEAETEISTHTSLAGGDASLCECDIIIINFNPHLPRGRRQRWVDVGDKRERISTHTSLAGGDEKIPVSFTLTEDDFNPHLPRGRRQQLFTILPDIFIQNHYFIPLLSAKSLLLLIP